MQTPVDRVLVFELDSVRQKERFEALGPQQAIREITGMIRAALLLSERLNITDTMLFDGVYFAHMPPSKLAAALGVHTAELPLTVLCRKQTLKETTHAILSNLGFTWQIEDREMRAAHLLAWTALDGLLSIEPQGALGAFPAPLGAWEASLSSEAKTLLNKVRVLTRRSDVYNLCEEAQPCVSG